MMASTRATCKLDSDALAEVLKKFVTKTEWLLMPARYESPKTKRARIMNMAGVARAIVKVAENLNLQKKQAEKAASLAFKKNQVNCDADAEGIKDAQLIRHNLRFTQQARSKGQGNDTWVEGLVRERVLWKAFVKAGTSVDARKRQEPEPEVDGGHESADLFSGGEEGEKKEGEDADDADDGEEDKVETSVQTPKPAHIEDRSSPTPKAAADEWLYGWEASLKSAWRAKIVNGKPQKKEYTKTVEELEGDNPIKALWPDGHSALIREMPTSLYKTIAARVEKKARPPKLMMPDGRPVFVKKNVAGHLCGSWCSEAQTVARSCSCVVTWIA